MNPEPAPGLVLYDYWRSSAAYRVRIALHLKGLVWEQRPVNLLHNGGEQHDGAYRALNPQGLVPALVHEGRVITQSLAICAYLDEAFPGHGLLPAETIDRARVNAMAQIIACDIHPLNNLRVQQYLGAELGAPQAAVVAWMNHWIVEGFAALECWLADGANPAPYCFGTQPGLADCCLIPQVYNAERYDCDLSGFPNIRKIADHCRALPSFSAAAPGVQPGAPGR